MSRFARRHRPLTTDHSRLETRNPTSTNLAVAAYTLAFGVSVATPLPGGLGAREAIIVGVLSGTQATLIVPVVLVRLILIGVEVLLLLAVRARTRSHA